MKKDLPKPDQERPHVVILGAGASRAAFPDGDARGRRLPVMDDLLDIVGLAPVLERHGVTNPPGNFEETYSKLAGDPAMADCLVQLDEVLREYFGALELPPEPTLYDHLLLGMREKDLVATFNWDPFLFQAHRRCREFAPMPHLAFLHGSVAVRFCDCDAPVLLGAPEWNCERCGKPLRPTPLLYPIEQKDYAADPAIAAAWRDTTMVMRRAYILTVFGYGAPRSDVEAQRLLRDAWGDPEERRFEETEIIDIRERDVIKELWEPFIHTHHWGLYANLYGTFVGRHPRRTCEALFNATMMNNPDPERAIPPGADWEELKAFLQPLVAAE